MIPVVVANLATSLWIQGSPEGKALFLKACASCHGPDGRAHTPIGRKIAVKDLTQSRLPDSNIVRQIDEGVRDRKGNLKMPSFKDQFSSEEKEALIQYVKSLRVDDPKE